MTALRQGADLSHPAAIMTRLADIENDLAERQNLLETAALNWYRAKREKEHAYAVAFLKAEGSVEARKADAMVETAYIGCEDEALFESLRAVVRTLETRATIGQSLLRAQGRA